MHRRVDDGSRLERGSGAAVAVAHSCVPCLVCKRALVHQLHCLHVANGWHVCPRVSGRAARTSSVSHLQARDIEYLVRDGGASSIEVMYDMCTPIAQAGPVMVRRC